MSGLLGVSERDRESEILTCPSWTRPERILYNFARVVEIAPISGILHVGSGVECVTCVGSTESRDFSSSGRVTEAEIDYEEKKRNDSKK